MTPDLYAGAVANTIPEAKKLRSAINRNAAATQILNLFAEL
jgi:hypothetical protein